MMECVKTLMEKSLAPKSQWNFWLLYQGINSALASLLGSRSAELHAAAL